MIKKKLKLEGIENIEIKLEDKEKGLTLSITGHLKDSSGQNYDEIYNQYIVGNPEFPKKAELARIIEIWKEYHLNDLTPGTPKQMEALKGKSLGYKEAVEYLKTLKLDVDNGYSYGSAWLMTQIPHGIVAELYDLMETW